MKKSCLSLLVVGVSAVSVQAAPFTAIRIGDVDGFGYGAAAGFTAANGGPANVGGGGVLRAEALPVIGDFLPDLNKDNVLATGSGDDFDNRSAAEVIGGSLSGSGFVDVGSNGSQFTDISLSTSYDASSAAGNVFDANTGMFGAGGPFPAAPSSTLPNQPGFRFDFMVAAGDIAPGAPIFFNMVFGDYDVTPARILFTRGDGTMFDAMVTPQNTGAGEDGLIQSASATLAYADVFSPGIGGWDGRLKVDFVAPSEPYTTFDFVELSTRPITPGDAIPEPVTATLGLMSLGALGKVMRRRTG